MDTVRYFELTDKGYQEAQPPGQRLWLPEAGLGLGLWRGRYQGLERCWLRFLDAEGAWVPTPLEREQRRAEQERQQAAQERQRAEQGRQQAAQERQRAEQEHQRAEQEHQRAEQERQRAEHERQQAAQERQRADRLAAQLKALGIEPE